MSPLPGAAEPSLSKSGRGHDLFNVSLQKPPGNALLNLNRMQPLASATFGGLHGKTLELALLWDLPEQAPQKPLLQDLTSFREFGQPTRTLATPFADLSGTSREVPTFVNEFWTARQRQAHSLHEISYRACFKPQLPRFFIERLTAPGEIVYDPFMGRGTTPLEAALLGRVPFGNDVNPLSIVMARPRLRPPDAGCESPRGFGKSNMTIRMISQRPAGFLPSGNVARDRLFKETSFACAVRPTCWMQWTSGLKWFR